MTVKWATFVFSTVLVPFARVHMAYKHRLNILDRFFEKKSFKFNTLVGALLGSTLYICTLPMRSFLVDKTMWQLLRESKRSQEELLAKNQQGEFGVLEHLKKLREVTGQLYAILDEEQVRKQLERARE